MNCILLKSLFSIFILFGLFSCSQKINPNNISDSSYFGGATEEKEIVLKGFIFIPKNKDSQKKDYQKNQVTKSIRFANGLMHLQGTIYEGYQIAINEVLPFGNEKLQVHYTVTGKVVLSKELSTFEFYLPTEPSTIFEKSENRCHLLEIKSVDQSNFWYHWKPELTDCPLVLNQDYLKVTSQLKPIQQTITTYPEYERLLINNNLITMTMFFGPNNDVSAHESPYVAKDSGAKEYLTTRNHLINQGFSSKILSHDDTVAIFSGSENQIASVPFVEEFYKSENEKLIRIRLFFINTDFYAKNSFYFHRSLKYALENESVILYSGHSGLGRNMNLKNIEHLHNFSIKFNKSYQIIYFGSCIPYAYFVDSFFTRKKSRTDPSGTKNLDILAYGKESHFGSVEHLRLIDAITSFAFEGKKKTYQEIVGENPADYFGVLGDEDNSLP